VKETKPYTIERQDSDDDLFDDGEVATKKKGMMLVA
jgi:hypothetical protein